MGPDPEKQWKVPFCIGWNLSLLQSQSLSISSKQKLLICKSQISCGCIHYRTKFCSWDLGEKKKFHVGGAKTKKSKSRSKVSKHLINVESK